MEKILQMKGIWGMSEMYQELMLACMEGHFMQTFYTTNCMLLSDLSTTSFNQS